MLSKAPIMKNLYPTIPAVLKAVSLMVFSTLLIQTTIPFKTLAQTTYTFTNCTATGRTGPTQTQVNAAYSGSSLAGAVTINTQGIQEWTVPATGIYHIESRGAQGGGANNYGKGARIIGDFSLNVGQVIKIIVGQQGPYTVSGGGGGGSFVIQSPYTSTASILVIAGGGGGQYNTTSPLYNADATTSNAGQWSSPSVSGGTSGNGGTGNSAGAAGGGGFSGNGGNGNWGTGGISFTNGGVGGNTAATVVGGFGGGGGTHGNTGGGAGGGGYSGGAGGDQSESYCAGAGGGSYNAGANPSNTAGYQSGNGSVVITSVGYAPTVTTQAASNVDYSSATFTGNITSLGTTNPTQYGHCWSVNQNPTTADAKTTLGSASATGSYISNVSGLIEGVMYYVRSYVTNSFGTNYGTQISFLCKSSSAYVFTNASATGQYGPTQSQINSAYTGTSLASSVTISTQGIQQWTVPLTGSYRITCLGAQGGGLNNFGKGAKMTGEFSLTAGQVIKIIVGQQGPFSQSGGGGGGSFVIQSPYTSTASILVIAGGGGGQYNTTSPLYNADATASNAGQWSSPSVSGGTSGNGGTGNSAGAAGGGGFSGNGGNGTYGTGGISFTNGGMGGNTAATVVGGFGGGGGTHGNTGGGAGGGGYSGGAGGDQSASYCAGAGGGSYNSGTNQVNVAGVRTSDGLILITTLTVIPTISTTGSLSTFSTCSGTASSEQSFTTSGLGLSANITVTAPTGFELSTTSGGSFSNTLTLTQTGGTVSSTTVYVRMAASATGTPSGNITLASTGATTQNMAVSGTVSSPPTVNAGDDQTVSTAYANLDGSISGSANTGAWSGGAGTYSLDNTSLTATYTPTAAERLAGTLTLTLTSADPDGPCGSATDQVALTFSASDKISITYGYWETSETWSPAGVPTLIDNVTINHSVTVNSSVAANPAICNNLSVNSGKLLTIESGKALTIKGNLANPSGAAFTIASGGSLITNGSITNNGTFTIQRSITKDRWHLISSPLTDATAQVFENDYLQSWSEVSAAWTDIISTGTALNPVQGYGLWTMYSSDHTYTFSGTPNTGSQEAQLTVSNNFPNPLTGNDGANLLGNPYPSAIDWSMLDNTYGAVYYWQGNGTDGDGTYLSWIDGTGPTNGQYIAPMQGFFIVTASNSTFSLTNANRTHTMGTYYKSATDTKDNLLVLETVSKDISDKLYVNFNDEATEEFDLQHDAYKFASGTPGLSELYSYTGDKKLSIDVRPACEVIQLGFSNSVSGTYSIGINQLNGISKATLEDTKTNTFTDLIKGSYAFSWATGEDNKRFKLHMGTVGVEESPDSDITIYSYQKTAYINLKNQHTGDIYIYNMAGQLITSRETASGLVNIGINAPGVYIVKVVSEKEITTTKVYIQ
jgi:hypothetical protein